MTKRLSVWWDNAVAGVLYLDENGDLGFAYDAEWLADGGRPAISFSLPKRDEPYGRRQTRPFFAGLLPDEGQRRAAARALGVSEQNDFGLLDALGGEIAGALTLLPEGERPPPYEGVMAARPLSDEALTKLLDELPRSPMLAGGEEGLRLSLAGAHQKLPVVLVDGRIALPGPGQPTTHILKPPIEDLPAATENEAFAMRLAAAVGLPTAAVSPHRVAGRPFLLVERYDRATDEAGRVRRLHQEDFCQALGFNPEHKYAADGGPTFPPCFALVTKACSRPAPNVLRLADAAIFNVMLGNADAHGKNFSLLHAPSDVLGGGVVLAPLYDLMCTAAYPEVAVKMAMKIGGRSTLDEFRPDTWQVFAENVRVSRTYIRRRVRELAAAITRHAAPVAQAIAAESPQTGGFDAAALAGLADIVTARAARAAAI